MGLKDSVTKDYMRDNIVFADVFNYFLYGGEAVIDPKSLVEMDSTELVVRTITVIIMGCRLNRNRNTGML